MEDATTIFKRCTSFVTSKGNQPGPPSPDHKNWRYASMLTNKTRRVWEIHIQRNHTSHMIKGGVKRIEGGEWGDATMSSDNGHFPYSVCHDLAAASGGRYLKDLDYRNGHRPRSFCQCINLLPANKSVLLMERQTVHHSDVVLTYKSIHRLKKWIFATD